MWVMLFDVLPPVADIITTAYAHESWESCVSSLYKYADIYANSNEYFLQNVSIESVSASNTYEIDEHSTIYTLSCIPLK